MGYSLPCRPAQRNPLFIQSGLVTGVSAGAATITFTTNDGAKTSTSAITVTA
ncbi:hypothetical protein C0558_15360 [Serratia marcescens]|uniref:Ig-like domain-containing protein n=1 Tax=Serratia TaxID=613 RepID=UPI0009F2B163|nr:MULTISPECIES: Ig-like domain-containing protein [Serratia]AUO03075.1 hypothetical protein C0558_15360 [Serratia marcescens]MBN5244792.1 Ig-like domain-containing protein [Serratia ureilytica]MBS7521264.1 Ig-like domain-containing protein [Serratia ureilytica]HEI8506999.1 Ig-like domain-containing protein [Serratia marcescens]